ncbi:uncharacterized protein LOC143888568 [Tasmannia lanceolata]|uniref:uncharacterized protein LOC143888568 n=1 Tax=Tasmannia lanceolata TaxID=3420 RepID=UPI00406492C3
MDAAATLIDVSAQNPKSHEEIFGTTDGVILNPLQRLFEMEVTKEEAPSTEVELKVSGVRDEMVDSELGSIVRGVKMDGRSRKPGRARKSPYYSGKTRKRRQKEGKKQGEDPNIPKPPPKKKGDDGKMRKGRRTALIERLLNDILMETDDVHLIAEDLQHLWNVRQYLTGTIVDIYGKHVQSSNDDGLADPTMGGIVFVPSVVHGTLTAVGTEVTEVQRVEKWRTAKDALHSRLINHHLEAVKMVLLPLCEDNHWVLLIVDMVNKIFHECNSCKGMEFQERAGLTVVLLKEYLKERGCDIDHFQYAQMENFPQQANGFDCGLFVLKAIDHLYANDPFTFSKFDIPAYRLQLCERFLRGEFGDCGDFLKGDI